MRAVDLIDKKRKKETLSKEEIAFLINGYVNNDIPDYQMASFAMAVVLNGMTDQEVADLTLIMMNSGDVIDLTSIEGVKVDKHSTGGIGDKTSLVLCPIIAALGIPVAKMSGRGLGHTGGTIDKLESIPGFKVEQSIEDFIRIVKDHGVAIISQSGNIVPADKKLYALRDVTATVQSIPLIAASIMSKKLATGSDAILLDVKVGNGAFMKTYEEAEKLGKTMISIGKLLNRDVKVEITNMDKPLGRAIGNRNEVIEAVHTLQGNGPADFQELILSSASTIIKQSKIEIEESAEAMVKKVIANGAALNKFYEMVEAQGGDVESIKADDFLDSKITLEIKAEENGYMNIISAIDLGLAAMKLGAGRAEKSDVIDNTAGIFINKKTNEEVKIGDALFTISSNIEIKDEIIKQVKESYKINKEKVNNPIILGKLS
ncbi:pyrimidine-nucleoside phosphorylase [Mycoplasma todarodis]|uniref:Pyrimidine-nucleoside phosphorylase n=1 Tax=Mycoplasma todarodis TaxID=1937191 RepID=A0A4R0XUT5_9MOLU|nr:pyrimidine-nucleoside phosphorylase [Mycoplasma todarodis]TCG11459.1 pyrimidine-nucleoside phosphorylase [Mycoplasma todarodis]